MTPSQAANVAVCSNDEVEQLKIQTYRRCFTEQASFDKELDVSVRTLCIQCVCECERLHLLHLTVTVIHALAYCRSVSNQRLDQNTERQNTSAIKYDVVQ